MSVVVGEGRRKAHRSHTPKPIQACTWLVRCQSFPYVSVLWFVHVGEGTRVCVCVLAFCEIKWNTEEREGEAGRVSSVIRSGQQDSSRALTTCSRMSGQWSAICCRTEFAYSCSSALSRSHCSSSDSSWGTREKQKCLLILHFIYPSS